MAMTAPTAEPIAEPTAPVRAASVQMPVPAGPLTATSVQLAAAPARAPARDGRCGRDRAKVQLVRTPRRSGRMQICTLPCAKRILW